MTATTTPPPSTAPLRRRRKRSSIPVAEILAIAFLALVVIATVFGPLLEPFDPLKIVGPPNQPPGVKFWAGTDNTGMDVFSRTIAGARIDVIIAITTTVAATLAGAVLGLLVGMNESHRGPVGALARAVARFLDLLGSVPAIILALVVASFFGITVPTMIVSLSVILLPIQARLVRTEVLKVRTDAYIDAARQAGLGEMSIVFRHVLPNSMVPALQNASAVFGITIVLTASLGFLGVGLPLPTPEWGSMITRGAGDAATGRWWSAGIPALALCLTVICVSIVGHRFSGGRRTSRGRRS